MLDSRRNKVLMVFGTLMAASLLPPVSTSSLDKHKFVPKHRTNQSQPLKGNPQLEFHIKLHALLLWASIGVLMPVGIIIVRMSRRVQGIKMLKALFYAHVIVQFTAILLATAAAVLALMNFENSLNNTHQRIGFVLYILIWLHPLVALVRPQRSEHWDGRDVSECARPISLIGLLHGVSYLPSGDRTMGSPASSSFLGGCIDPHSFLLRPDQSRFDLLTREEDLETRQRINWVSILIKRLMKKGRSICCSKPLRLGYDEESYSKNFDDGQWNE
ncbi:hypothetical protein ZIOFF_047080 [Zingiber officinale]|uniref:Cytochrome b561 domain-containing protein n=1 Tax=Zingiber officinale TaxID=94328 RepID=A0A8J5G5M3_ZINOF|nr:hypothetical protein ZIOFF_047080 [Zingiber officinale]